jgi:hypothetical protein
MRRVKSGHWGNPFTKENANFFRQRGLETRRFNAEKRLAKVLCGGEPSEPVSQARLGGPSQPSKPPRTDAAEQNPVVDAKPALAHIPPVPSLQPGGEILYGYELAPGVWQKAKPPAPLPNGFTQAAVLRAQRMYPRHWSGKRPHDRPR